MSKVGIFSGFHCRCVGSVKVQFHFTSKNKKINPITGQRCPDGSRKLRFLDFMTMAQDGGKVVSLRHRPLFTYRKYSWNSCLLEADSIPGP